MFCTIQIYCQPNIKKKNYFNFVALSDDSLNQTLRALMISYQSYFLFLYIEIIDNCSWLDTVKVLFSVLLISDLLISTGRKVTKSFYGCSCFGA